jgi:hypothetical protein
MIIGENSYDRRMKNETTVAGQLNDMDDGSDGWISDCCRGLLYLSLHIVSPTSSIEDGMTSSIITVSVEPHLAFAPRVLCGMAIFGRPWRYGTKLPVVEVTGASDGLVTKLCTNIRTLSEVPVTYLPLTYRTSSLFVSTRMVVPTRYCCSYSYS